VILISKITFFFGLFLVLILDLFFIGAISNFGISKLNFIYFAVVLLFFILPLISIFGVIKSPNNTSYNFIFGITMISAVVIYSISMIALNW
jgi:hypothetical protein